MAGDGIANTVFPTAGQGLTLDLNGLIPVVVLAPNPTNAYVLTYDGATKQAKWALVPVSALSGYPSDSTKVLLGDGTWAQVATAQIANGTIVDADINGSAAIAKSKLANLDVVNADVNAAAAIAYSKLNLASSIVSGDIVNGTIVDADVSGAAAIAQSKVAFDAWQNYTPALTATTTNPTLGTSPSQKGRFVQVGKTVHGKAEIIFGTGAPTAGSGSYLISLPVTASLGGITNPAAGTGWIFDSSAVLVRTVAVELYLSTTGLLLRVDNLGGGVVTNAVPWTWAASDQLTVCFTYEAA